MRSLFCFGASMACLASSPAGAQNADILLLMRGADTIAIERFDFKVDRLEGELLFKAAGARFTYTAHLDSSLQVSRFENAFRPATSDPVGTPQQSAVLTFSGDSVIAIIEPGANIQRIKTQAGAIPFINPSFALVELATRRARRAGGAALTVPLFAVSGGQTLPVPLTPIGADTIVVTLGAEMRLAVDAEGRITGGVIPSQGLELRRARATGQESLRQEAPDYSSPAGAPYTAETVRVSTPMGHTLVGTLTIPTARRGRLPAVVTITGSGAQDRDEAISLVRGYRPFRQLADTLGRVGIAVLRMDDRGFGESGGNIATATSRDFADDIRAGVAYLRTRSEIDPDRIVLVGHSEGGLIGPMVAASDPQLRALVVMAGPSRSGRRILEFQNRNGIEQTPAIPVAARDSMLRAAMDTVDAMGKRQPWMGFFLDYDPLATARRVRTPTLILHGGTDQQVTPDQAVELAAAFRAGGNSDVTVQVFPEANHLFVQDPNGFPGGYSSLKDGRVRGDVVETLVRWLREKTAGGMP